jgi:hypothetical protein
MAKKKQPTDLNQLAHSIVGQAIGQTSEDEIRSQAAKLLGRLGGLKGGPARYKALTKKRRQEIAKKAAQVRWKK